MSEYRYISELYHHGILGMKWGIRRYQNRDGSLTKAGMKRYNKTKYWSDDKKENTPEKKKVTKEQFLKTVYKNNDPALLYKYRDQFTYKELNDAYKMLVLQKDIKKLASDQKVQKGKKAFEGLNKTLKTTSEISGSTYKILKDVGLIEEFNKKDDDKKGKKKRSGFIGAFDLVQEMMNESDNDSDNEKEDKKD